MINNKTLENVTDRWSGLKLTLFRIIFVYFVLYNFPRPLGRLSRLIPIPGFEQTLLYYRDFVRMIGVWVGKTVFDKEITIFPLGSGDTTYNYVIIYTFLIISLAVTVIWALIDKNRLNYDRLFRFFHTYIRYVLAFILIGYGTSKIIPAQFGTPFLFQLIRPYGDSSPMGLLWTFMGSSYPFIIFTGLGEAFAGLLLVFRRTILAGALTAISILSVIVMMNFSYDVPVKLLSSHLLLMSVIVTIPYIGRLLNFFVLNRKTSPMNHVPLFRRKRLNLGLSIAGKVLAIAFIVYGLYGSYQAQTKFWNAPKSPFYGIWEVEKIEIDGKVEPPTLSNEKRWRRVVFDRPTLLSIQLTSDALLHLRLKTDKEKKTFVVKSNRSTKAEGKFRYQRDGNEKLILTGTFNKKPFNAILRLDSDKKFLLIERGFNWINETPLNR